MAMAQSFGMCMQCNAMQQWEAEEEETPCGRNSAQQRFMPSLLLDAATIPPYVASVHFTVCPTPLSWYLFRTRFFFDNMANVVSIHSLPFWITTTRLYYQYYCVLIESILCVTLYSILCSSIVSICYVLFIGAHCVMFFGYLCVVLESTKFYLIFK